MDAITLLKQDHQAVEKLFKQFERAGDDAHVEKRRLVDQMIEELSKHASVEEQLFYPVARAAVPDTEDVALESLEEHHIVKWVLSELDGMDPKAERFDAKVTVLMENVRHHVEEEEDEFFPKVRDELGRKALGELGDAMERAKAVAPTHPHPRAPDTPPGNLVVGTAAGVADRVGDTVSGLAQGGVAAVQDVIARVLGMKRKAPAPRGSSTATKTARTTRSRVADATDKAASATRTTKRTAKKAGRSATKKASRVAKRATRSAKRGSGAAKSSAKRASGTAKRATKTSAKRASGTAKRATKTTAKRASGTAKRAKKTTAKRSPRTTKKARSSR